MVIAYRASRDSPNQYLHSTGSTLDVDTTNPTGFILREATTPKHKLDLSFWEANFCSVKVSGTKRYLGWEENTLVVMAKVKDQAQFKLDTTPLQSGEGESVCVLYNIQMNYLHGK